MARTSIVLVPGFFGFTEMGAIQYFFGVDDELDKTFAKHGFDADVSIVSTMPTASIRDRAMRVSMHVEEACKDAEEIHLVGHSTGGLDARMIVSSTAEEWADREWVKKIRSVTTISTPHHGTPLASLFAGTMGKPALKLFSAVSAYVFRKPRLPVRLALKLGGLASRFDDFAGLKNTSLDSVYKSFLKDFSEERRERIARYWSDIASDQTLLFQLTPDACALLNAAIGKPQGVAFSSVITRAAPLRASSVRKLKFDVYAQALHLLFRVLHAGVASGKMLPIEVSDSQRRALLNAFGTVPDYDDNDGVVPTLSQVWGEVIYACDADHLDTMGHYQPNSDSQSADWFPSDSGFDTRQFSELWESVANFMMKSSVAASS